MRHASCGNKALIKISTKIEMFYPLRRRLRKILRTPCAPAHGTLCGTPQRIWICRSIGSRMSKHSSTLKHPNHFFILLSTLKQSDTFYPCKVPYPSDFAFSNPNLFWNHFPHLQSLVSMPVSFTPHFEPYIYTHFVCFHSLVFLATCTKAWHPFFSKMFYFLFFFIFKKTFFNEKLNKMPQAYFLWYRGEGGNFCREKFLWEKICPNFLDSIFPAFFRNMTEFSRPT